MRMLISPALAAALFLVHPAANPALAQTAAPAADATQPAADPATATPSADTAQAPATGDGTTEPADSAAEVPAATADQGATGSNDAAAATATPDAAPATPVSIDTVVATVNGTDLTLGHMLAAKAQLPDQYKQLPDDVLFGALVEQLTQQQAVADKAGDLSKASEYALENERRTLAVAEVLNDYLATAVTDDAVRKAYDAVVAAAEPEQEYSAAHILVETEDEAKAIAEEAKGGADFAELAKSKSTGPSGPSGGDLGWFSKGMMVPEFETAVTSMKPGDVSDPVKSQFGWHVIKLNDVREKPAPKFEDVRDQVAQSVQQQAVQDYLARAMDGAEITRADPATIPAAVLSDPSLLTD